MAEGARPRTAGKARRADPGRLRRLPEPVRPGAQQYRTASGESLNVLSLPDLRGQAVREPGQAPDRTGRVGSASDGSLADGHRAVARSAEHRDPAWAARSG